MIARCKDVSINTKPMILDRHSAVAIDSVEDIVAENFIRVCYLYGCYKRVYAVFQFKNTLNIRSHKEQRVTIP